ncbi:MAG: primosomal protein N' [Candidatus Eisenbacteria bacterium]|uniref:Replication restart protein PriA n=1 Tax=Eiseniibacteriota bacterium TaxID=2212470 RepID=A0A538T3Y8_UNCEI|nr:MAG: primosomal protein N' [Candidatus Eisenbacteria bacterium]
MALVRVAVPIPLAREEALVYEIPEEETPEVGLRVLVPVGARRVWGTVLGVEATPPEFRVRRISGIPEPRLVVTPELLDLCRWVADYYAANLSDVLQAAVPSPTGLTRRAARGPAEEAAAWLAVAPPRREELNEEQLAALVALEEALRTREFRAFLLFGVTGSGKTAVYLHAAAEALKLGGQTLILVPEIALSPQTLDSFRRAGFERVALYHSTLRPRERADVWRAAAAGEIDLVVGTRSAVFLPFRNLRLAVVDEEQDGAYKQDDAPRYHARDVALVRAQRLGGTVILASATPSLESFARVKRGQCGLLRLTRRIDGRPLPTVRITDLRHRAASAPAGGSRYLTPPLVLAMAKTLERREQAILFLNRRGHSTYLQCRGCGDVARCERCDVSLTVHLEDQSLRCHYCGAERKLTPACAGCGASNLWFGGVGIQRIEREVARLFPKARIARLDFDATRKRGSAAAILSAFRAGGTDFLLGTQMVAKGFDFPMVTLVGIIVADLQLYLPDFRAAERTFQLLTQVAGRAGRGERAGEVILQTYDPEHPALRCAAAQDFEMFFDQEAAERRELCYPPFGHLVEIEIRGAKKERVIREAGMIRDTLAALARGVEVELLGPAPKPIARIQGAERWHILIRSGSRKTLQTYLKGAVPALRARARTGLRVSVDVDPRHVL